MALCGPVGAWAQEQAPRLEELIPDGAVNNAEQWARDDAADKDGQGQPASVPQALDTGADEAATVSPRELELPAIVPIEPGEEIDFADLELEGPKLDFAGAETAQIDEGLVLGFPQKHPPFTHRDAFIGRFESLSTIEQLGSEEGNFAQLAARARQDEELLNNLLRVYGYYDGRVIRSIADDAVQTAAGQTPRVRFDIIPGKRYKYGAVDLGSLASAPDAEALRAAFGIHSGDFLQSDKIVEERLALDVALGESGYPFAEIADPELLIDHQRLEGDLAMPVQPGGKYVFGGITSDDPEFLSGEHLEEIARFEPGDGYRRSLSNDLRRAILATGLVSSVSITPQEVAPPQAGKPGVVGMDVALERGKLRTIAGAIGYGSQEGIRLQASWEHRNFFPPEGALKLRGVLGTQEQLAGISFRKNNFGGRDRILNVDAYLSTIDSPAFEARTAAFVATYERQSTLLFQKPLSWSIGLELIATGERPPAVNGVAQPRQTFFVAATPAFVQIDTTDDLLDPGKGFRLSARVSPEASRTNGMESFYVRNRIDASYYQRIGDNVVLAGRGAFGSIVGADLIEIAPSRRLYAGGGSSVRGYGYREIGPRNALGEPSGGRSLVELALEARIRTGLFGGALALVPFIDAGSVSASVTPDFDEIKVGAGIGLRYYTNFGPIRVDLGVPLNPGPNDNPVAVYVSLGQAF